MLGPPPGTAAAANRQVPLGSTTPSSPAARPAAPRAQTCLSQRWSRRRPVVTVRRFNAGKTKAAITAPTNRMAKPIAVNGPQPDSPGPSSCRVSFPGGAATISRPSERMRRTDPRRSPHRERQHEEEPEADTRPAARGSQRQTPQADVGARRPAGAAADAGALDMRTAIVSTYPPRACGIGTFSADLRATLTGTGIVTRADLVAVVNEPSSPQRRGVLATHLARSHQHAATQRPG